MFALLRRKDDVEIRASLLPRIVSAEAVAAVWPAGLAGEDDESWDWPTLVADHPLGDWSHKELQVDGSAQGLMILKDRWELRAPANTGREGCYIEYVAAAPWNRGKSKDARFGRVTPVGLIMMVAAINHSITSGNDGRLAWHSKPGALAWYRNVLPGLWSGGPDASEDDFEYFELTVNVAEAFLARHGSLIIEEQA